MSGVYPLGAEPLARSYPPAPTGAAFTELVKAADGDGQYLIEITAYKGGEARSGGLWTLGEGPLGAVAGGVGVDVGQVTLKWADRHWTGAPTDADRPNGFYEGRVTVPLLIERTMPLLPEEDRRAQRQFGAIEIANGDGELDPVVQSYAVDGRRVIVRFGPYMGAYSEFATIADVVATGWAADDLTVRLGLRDRSYNLDLPLQANLYTGAGGAEGGVEVQGKPKPLTFGVCRNVAPALIDPTNLVYQVHDGAIAAIDDVYDRGAALTDSTDNAADYAALVALAVAAGEFATCTALGLFKVGASPDGLITADVRGDAPTVTAAGAGTGYADTLDVIALRVLIDRAGLDATFVNAATFAGAATIAGSIGLHIGVDETPTTAQALSALLAAVGGFWGAARDGRIRAGRLGDPAARTPNLYIDEYDILSLEPEEPPTPRWRQRVAWRRNWTVQRGEDLAASVTDARRQFLTGAVRVATAADSDVRARHLQALDPAPLATLYDLEADAQTLATYLQGLHGPDRQIVRVTVKRLGYLVDLAKIVHLTWPRLGLANGKKFVVVGVREEADTDTTILRLWG